MQALNSFLAHPFGTGVSAPAGNPFSRYAAGLLVVAIVLASVAFIDLSFSSALADTNADKPTTAPANEPPEMANQPHRWRHFVRIVVSNDGITFQGNPTNWQDISKLDAERSPEVRKHTVVEICRGSERFSFSQIQVDDVPQPTYKQAKIEALEFVQHQGYEYLTDIGFQPFGSRGSRSQYLPPLTQRGRWRHFVRIVVSKNGMTFEGKPATWEQVEKSAAAADPELKGFTVLEIANASNDIPEGAYSQAKSKAHEIAQKYGYEYLSDIGVHPLGSAGSKSQFMRDDNQPGYWRQYVTFVSAPDQQMTLQGEPVTKEQLRDKRSAVPNKPETVLCIAGASPNMSENSVLQIIAPAVYLLDFNQISWIGVHPLGTKLGPSIFTPTTNVASTQAAKPEGAITASLQHGHNGDYLELSFPGRTLEDAMNDELAEKFKPLLKGEPSVKFDTPKARPIRLTAWIADTDIYGTVLYLPSKNIFYFYGSPLKLNSTPQKHFYGPFPADALAKLNLKDIPQTNSGKLSR